MGKYKELIAEVLTIRAGLFQQLSYRILQKHDIKIYYGAFLPVR
jgi:hypothetical protein